MEVKMIATRAFRYGTRALTAGEPFDAKDRIHAALLKQRKKAKEAPDQQRRRGRPPKIEQPEAETQPPSVEPMPPIEQPQTEPMPPQPQEEPQPEPAHQQAEQSRGRVGATRFPRGIRS